MSRERIEKSRINICYRSAAWFLLWNTFLAPPPNSLILKLFLRAKKKIMSPTSIKCLFIFLERSACKNIIEKFIFAIPRGLFSGGRKSSRCICKSIKSKPLLGKQFKLRRKLTAAVTRSRANFYDGTFRCFRPPMWKIVSENQILCFKQFRRRLFWFCFFAFISEDYFRFSNESSVEWDRKENSLELICS